MTGGLDVGAFLLIGMLLVALWVEGLIAARSSRESRESRDFFDYWVSEVSDEWSWEDVVRTSDEISGLPEVHS